MTEYLHQTDSANASLYALCNGLRYFGRNTPQPNTPEWANLIASAKRIDELAARLGLRRTKIPTKDLAKHIPALVVVYVETSKTRQLALIIGTGEDDTVRVVNYRPDGPTVEVVPIGELRIPDAPLGGAWALSLVEAEAAA